MTGEQLKAWRVARHMTQRRMAAWMGASRRSVITWEQASRVQRLVELACYAVDNGVLAFDGSGTSRTLLSRYEGRN